MSEGLEVVEFRGDAPKVEIDAEPQTPHGFKPVRLVLPDGMLPHQSFALRIGNPAADGDLVALVLPSPVHNLAFNIWSGRADGDNEVDWFEAGWGESLPRCSIEAAPASALRIFAPSLVEAGTPFTVKIAVTDAYDSAAYPPFEGVVRLEPGAAGLPDHVRIAAEDASTVVEGVTITEPGVHRITGYLDGNAFESNPIVVREQVDVPIYWGMLHGHDWHSECWGDGPDNYYRFGRDVSGLDYLALSDHINVTPRDAYGGRLYPYRSGTAITGRDAYLENVRAAEKHYRPGAFATLIGYELSPYTPLHYTVFWPEATEENFERMFVDEDCAFLPVTEANLRSTNALVLPHMHATYVPYNLFAAGLNDAGEPLVPAVEGYSDWGMTFHPPSEQDELIGGLTHDAARPFYEWLGRGIAVGFIGDSDTHTGLPGRRHPGSPSPVHLRPQGLTAVRAHELSRHGVVDGYRSRFVYGTSGERIFLDVHIGSTRMGEKHVADGPFMVRVEVAGTDVIERIGLYDPDGLVQEQTLGTAREETVEFEVAKPSRPETPYVVEIVQANHHRAWSSPIWVRDAALPDLSWQPQDNGALHLVNAGGGTAHGVNVAHHATQHPFAAPPIPHPAREETSRWAKLWTHRWNDHRATLFFLWKDLELDGALYVEGFERYEVEMEMPQLGLFPVADDGNGRIAFTSKVENAHMSKLVWGLNVTVDVSHRVPSRVRLELAAETELRLAEETLRVTTIELPLNGLSEPFESRTCVGDLAPGEHWQAPSTSGLWSADPDNELLALSDSGGLYRGASGAVDG
jgi:hypothetical protein